MSKLVFSKPQVLEKNIYYLMVILIKSSKSSFISWMLLQVEQVLFHHDFFAGKKFIDTSISKFINIKIAKFKILYFLFVPPIPLAMRKMIF